LQRASAGELGHAARASTATASDRKVIDPKYDTCAKQGAQHPFKKFSWPIFTGKCTAMCLQINAAEMIGLQSCKQFKSVMFPGY
jgi:hypothetical protein